MVACEGLSAEVLTNYTCTAGRNPGKTRFSPYHTMQVQFGGNDRAFGFGKTVSDLYVINTHQFSRLLKPTRGVFLDLYGDDPGEHYIIDFIEVKLEKES